MKKSHVACGVLLSALLLALGWLGTTDVKTPSVTVRDVRQPETLLLGTKSVAHSSYALSSNGQCIRTHSTYGINIKGSGDIDGQATISLLLNGAPYKVARVSGKVDFEWGGDWYAETAEIRYEPVNVRSGEVIVHYRFLQ